jgi:uncharacterized protein
MALEAQLKDAVKAAMKQGQPARLEILRFLLAQLQAKSIEKRGTGQAEILNEEDVLQVLQKEAKKRKEAAELYVKGGRPDLAEKEEAELVIIYEFIPQPMDRAAVAAVVDELKATGLNDFNSLMKAVMARLKGQADGKTVGEVVREKLQ